MRGNGRRRAAKRRRVVFLAVVLVVIVGAVVFIVGGGQAGEFNKGKDPAQTEDGTGGQSEDPVDQAAAEREKTLAADREAGLFILINKQNEVARDYQPEDLVEVKYYAADRSAAGRTMRAVAAEHFNQLAEEAQTLGMEFVVTTAYRSYDFQKTLFDNYVKKDGEEAANKYSARPGQSEHQTGLAADVSSPSVGYRLTVDYADTAEGKWLAENAHRFGFIIRFPKGKEDITGYQYEPWHIRYVGQTAAEEIYEKGLTLEEYLTQSK